MVIDFGKNADHALQFAVFDAKTGKRLDNVLPIIFADDDRGILKYYRRLPAGGFVQRDGSPEVVEENRKIDIVPKR